MVPSKSPPDRAPLFVLEPVRITLAAAGLALVAIVAVPEKRDASPTRRDASTATAPATHDRRAHEAALSLVRAEPSPDARWLAVEARRAGARDTSMWIIDLSDEGARPLAGYEPSWTPAAWSDANLLRVRTADSKPSSSDVRWIDPRSGAEVDPGQSPSAPAHASSSNATAPWARLSIQSKSDRRMVHVVEWPERALSFELPTRSPGVIVSQLTREPGVVFYSERESGAVRVYRYDMAKSEQRELIALQKGGTWSVAPDGQALVATDAQRTRVYSAEDGSPIAGPWKRGEARWIDEATSRHLLLDWDGELVVIDLVRDHQLALGRDGGDAMQIRPLADGRFLVQREDRIELLDDRAQLERVVFPPES